MTTERCLAGTDGLRVGLLGGSFDPPHTGHLHLSLEALKRFGLDRVVWLVSPGNPLKPDAPAAMSRRMQAAAALIDHPAICVSAFEERQGTRYTAETLRTLQHRHPKVRFTWLMGADNLAQFHRWRDWQDIVARVPIGIVARPGHRQKGLNAKMARVFSKARLPASASTALGGAQAPAWCFVNMPMRADSSTALRAEGAWSRVAAKL